jgi:hypothetical protein
VGCPLSPAAAAATAKSIDGSNLVESAKSTTTESGSSPSVFSPALECPSLFSRSDDVPEGGRSAAAGPHHGSPQSQSWELELTAMASALQAGRKRHHRFHPHSQGANPTAGAVPQPHPDLVEHSQQTPLGIVTNPVYLASPFKDGTPSFAGTQTGVEDITAQSVKSRVGPHTSQPSPDPLQASYFHLNLFSSEALAPAYTTTESGHLSQCGLGAAAESAATAAVRTHVVDLSVSDLVAPQLGPTSAPLPSMYWLLFDAEEHEEHDSVDGRLRADDASRRASSRPLLGMMPPHVTVPVTPTPVSFLAKWEDMLALEGRIRSVSDGVKLVKSKQAQAARAAEVHRMKQGSRRGEMTLTGTGTGKVVYCTALQFVSCGTLIRGQSRPRPPGSRS